MPNIFLSAAAGESGSQPPVRPWQSGDLQAIFYRNMSAFHVVTTENQDDR